MKHFSDDGCNSSPEYDYILFHRYSDENEEYDKSVCPPVHIEDYDSMEEYESGIKHFED